MRIYNMNTADMNARFVKAVAAGVPAAIALGIVYGMFVRTVHIEFSVLYVLLGWTIGLVIKKVGRGVTQRFQVLAAVCAVLSILIADILIVSGMYGLVVSAVPLMWKFVITAVARNYADMSISGLLTLAFRAFAVFAAYNNAIIF